MNRLALSILFLNLCFGLVTTCRNPTSTNDPQVARANKSEQSKPTADAIDKGDLKFVYKQWPRPSEQCEFASDLDALAEIVTNLNEKIALPWDITVSVEDCGEPDSYYDKDTRTLTVCYQQIDEFNHLFSPTIKDKTKLDDAVRGAVASTFFHELGHALVDAWKIPITGKEEDAVDQLSTLVLINNTKNGEQMALAGALSFKLQADLAKGEERVFWDEHSLDEQRFYDSVCMIYGSAPDKYAYLVKDGTLPEERAHLCREDYPKIATAWRQLLRPYLKNPTTMHLSSQSFSSTL